MRTYIFTETEQNILKRFLRDENIEDINEKIHLLTTLSRIKNTINLSDQIDIYINIKNKLSRITSIKNHFSSLKTH